LSAAAVAPRANESVYVIDADADVCRKRLTLRQGTPQWVMPDDGPSLYEKILNEVRSQSHVKLLSQLHYSNHPHSRRSVEP
jgi:hypothetical protein